MELKNKNIFIILKKYFVFKYFDFLCTFVSFLYIDHIRGYVL